MSVKRKGAEVWQHFGISSWERLLTVLLGCWLNHSKVYSHCKIRGSGLSLSQTFKLRPSAPCSACLTANTLPLKEISSSCVNHGSFYPKALPTAYKRLVEGKQEKFGFIQLTTIGGNSEPEKGRICWSFVRRSKYNTIIWKHSSSIHYPVFMIGTFPSKQTKFNCQAQDKSVTLICWLSHQFACACVWFGLFLLKAPLVYSREIFPKTIEQNSFSSLSTRTKHNKLANTKVSSCQRTNHLGPLSLVQ